MSAFIFSSWCISPLLCHGGWTQPEGSYYTKIWLRQISGESVYLSNGEIYPAAESYLDQSLNLYGEYGISERLTLTGSVSPWGRSRFIADEERAPLRSRGEREEESDYLGALSLGARYQLLPEGPLRFSAFGSYRFSPPVGDEPLAEVVSLGDEERSCVGEPCVIVWQPTLSAHTFEAGLALGYGLPAGFWSQLSSGLRHTVSLDERYRISPALVGMAQLGWASGTVEALGELGFVFDLHLNLLEPFAEVEDSVASGVAQTRYLGMGWSASLWVVDRMGFNVSQEGVFYAEANAATPSWTFGVELK